MNKNLSVSYIQRKEDRKGQIFNPIQIHYEHPTLQKKATEMKTRRNTKMKTVTKSELGFSSIFAYFLNFKSYITLFKS